MIYKLTKIGMNRLIDLIRLYFETFNEGKWADIEIVDFYPFQTQIVPSIIIEPSPGSIKRLGLADILTYKDNKLIVGGKFNLEYTITAQAERTGEKEALIDGLAVLFMYLGRESLLEHGIILSPESPRFAGESQEEQEGRMIFRAQLSIACQTEWTDEIEKDVIERFGINISLYDS